MDKRRGYIPAFMLLFTGPAWLQAQNPAPRHGPAGIWVFRENHAALSAAGVSRSRPPRLQPASHHDLRSLVSHAARRYQVSPRLARAVARQESDWNPRAVSTAGAMGLMQLMPGTAQDLGVRDPFNPRQNARAGVQYLKAMLERYHGNRRLGLAAYNAGPGAVDASGGHVPPYPETRAYVRTILRQLAHARPSGHAAAHAAPGPVPMRESEQNGALLFSNTD